MKYLLLTILGMLAVVSVCARNHKTLVVYYSQTGNTKAVAEIFQKELDADILELKCKVPYPDDFNATVEESRDEIQKNTGRALKNGKINLRKYKTIYIGYPVWFGTYAPPVATFIKENKLSGKEVVLFCTFGSGGTKSSSEGFKAACPEATLIDAFGIAGRRVEANAEKEVKSFLASVGSEKKMMTGAYSDQRPLDENALKAFHAAVDGKYDYLHLTPISVSSQVVAGINYMFTCTQKMGEEDVNQVTVKIFAPLPGRGEPELVEVIR